MYSMHQGKKMILSICTNLNTILKEKILLVYCILLMKMIMGILQQLKAMFSLKSKSKRFTYYCRNCLNEY